MYRLVLRRAALLVAVFVGFRLFARHLLPLMLPFFAGLLLAMAAEPAVGLATRLKLPRWAASGVGVGITLVGLVCLAGVLGAILVRGLGVLARHLPDLQNKVQQTTRQLENLLQNAAQNAPDGVQPLVDRSVSRLFSSGSDLVEQATVRLPGAVTAFLSRVPDGALGICTGVLSGFMLSARLPKLKTLLAQKMPPAAKGRLLPACHRAKHALWGWLKAQCKLCAITFSIVLVGFLVLQVPYAPVWAAAVALVDAVPVLGTGTVLLPWALVSLLQHQPLRTVGLLCICAATFLARTILEPRLVGKHLGLDPLVTLIFFYLGYRFWGIPGMLLTPVLAAAVKAAAQPIEN